MKLAYSAFVLTLLLVGACVYLFWQGYQDRSTLQAQSSRMAELESKVGAIEGISGSDAAPAGGADAPAPAVAEAQDRMEKARIAAERDTLAAEKEAMSQQIAALEAERAILERGVAAAAAANQIQSNAGSPTSPGTPSVGSPGVTAMAPASPDPRASAGLPQLPTLPPLDPPPGLVDAGAGGSTSTQALPNLGSPAPSPGAPPLAAAESAPADPVSTLTPIQRQIQGSPAIGEVLEYISEGAFVVINAGSDRRVTEGDEFALRRETYLVARIRVSAVEAGQAIGNVVEGSIPLGMTIQGGEAVIMPPSGL